MALFTKQTLIEDVIGCDHLTNFREIVLYWYSIYYDIRTKPFTFSRVIYVPFSEFKIIPRKQANFIRGKLVLSP